MLVDRSRVVPREMTPGSQLDTREGQKLKQQNCPSVSPRAGRASSSTLLYSSPFSTFYLHFSV